jgi:hypothetical protein
LTHFRIAAHHERAQARGLSPADFVRSGEEAHRIRVFRRGTIAAKEPLPWQGCRKDRPAEPGDASNSGRHPLAIYSIPRKETSWPTWHPAEFVTKMVDAGESKIFMSTRDTLVRAYMAGAILALAAAFAITVTVQTGQPLLGAVLFPVGFCMLYLLGFDLLTGVFTLMPPGLDRQATRRDRRRHSAQLDAGILRQLRRRPDGGGDDGDHLDLRLHRGAEYRGQKSAPSAKAARSVTPPTAQPAC